MVDELVARRLLAALAPQEIALALAAAEEVNERRGRSNRALELRVERARYEAVRAERAFHQCDPDNRTRRAQPGDALGAHAPRAQGRRGRARRHTTTQAVEPSREQIEALARDVPALWAANGTTPKDRKRPLRALIADVTITSQPAGNQLSVGIRWRSGAAEQHTITRPPTIDDTNPHPTP